jgi:hypothetical protein
VDYGLEAQRAAEEHLAACWEFFNGDYEGVAEDPASAPFCGCPTCEVREVLYAAWPLLQREAQDEIDRLRRVEKLFHDIVIVAGTIGPDQQLNLAWLQQLERLAADDVGAEQEDQNEGGGDDRGHDVEP